MAWPCLAVKIGNHGACKDGDILQGFTTVDAIRVELEHICHPRKAGGGVRAHRNSNSVAKDFEEMSYRYRFDRVSKHEVKRLEIDTGEEHIVGALPVEIDGKQQHIMVDQFVKRRLEHHGHRMYGEPGSEFWFGGRMKRDYETILKIRDHVYERLGKNIEDRGNAPEGPPWPVGLVERFSYLFFDVEELTKDRKEELARPIYDAFRAEPEILYKRNHFVDWREIVPAEYHERVLNPYGNSDLRGEFLLREPEIVRAKCL